MPAKETWKFSDLSTVLIVILIIVLVLTALYCGIVKFRTRIKTVKKNSSADEQRVKGCGKKTLSFLKGSFVFILAPK